MVDFNDAQPVTFPHYVMTHMAKRGDNPKHLIETVLSGLWASTECAHVFEIVWSVDENQFLPLWISAPSSYWNEFIEQIRLENGAAVDSVITGFEELLAGESDKDEDRG